MNKEHYAIYPTDCTVKKYFDHIQYHPKACKEERFDKPTRKCSRPKNHAGAHETTYTVSKASARWYSDSSEL